jgi:hypothetical protein
MAKVEILIETRLVGSMLCDVVWCGVCYVTDVLG